MKPARSLLYVYAVCPRLHARVDLTGVAGEPLQIFAAAGLAAVIGELVRAPRVNITAFRKHDAVVRALACRFPAVVPLRFGSCLAGTEDLRQVLEAHATPLRAKLCLLRGRVQMTLRGVDHGCGRPAKSDQDARAATGRAYLQARAITTVREDEVPSLAPLLPAVSRWVRAERIEKRAGIVSVHHLVPQGCVAAYARAMHRTAEAECVRMTLTGPFPPYAFGRL
ncbi:GvpL/GvpF family gas vesicle protein [Usitatibacter palustris]|uniref:Gas vesicle synthesis protein GvpL/GvpF n=1 Tax=Usitatibacter palustris TaxID=2732487 RepID=A0A6M4HBT8_9PROT|nr:GvpL/GvpF family gas vesicle protein [Usitatibacter palustris]QJR16278.1 hypothetical protein DSM104440_03107 [Usitatibacter palustris]